MPKDRSGLVRLQMVPKGVCRPTQLHDMSVTFVYRGMRAREIQVYPVTTLGVEEMRPDTICTITDAA